MAEVAEQPVQNQEPFKAVPTTMEMLDRLKIAPKEEAPKPTEPIATTSDPIKPVQAGSTAAPEPLQPTPESLFAPPAVESMPELPADSFKTEKAHVDYEKWRKHQASLETKIRELESAPKADVEAQARIQQLEGRLQEMSGAFEEIDLMRHPAIQAQIVRPRAELMDRAGKLLADVGVETDMLSKALSLSGKARIEALDGLNEEIQSPTVRMQLLDIVSRVEGIDQQASAIMADRQATKARLDLEERANRHTQAQNQEKSLVGLVDVAFGRLRDEAGFEFLREVEGDDKWNQGVKDVRTAAVELLTKNSDPQQLAAATVLAPLAAKYRAGMLSWRDRALAAEKEVKEFKGAEPGLGGQGGSTNGAPSEPKSVRDVMAQFLK